MKLQPTNDFDVEVVGSNTSSSFSIAMNGKAFRVLSSTLYQNKIGSIVREISCNAVDGHTMAGKKDVPFEIHLPDMFEPWFSVRDFGVGMNRQTIQNVFTKYFESTKDQSNDTIGAFGIGAKSPFSYTDQFTITSIIDGEKVVYSAYILNDLPKIDEMHSEPSDEPQGVEVKISVKKEDYNNFKSEVREQLRYFTVKPNITNGSIDWIETIQSETLFEGENFSLTKARYGACGIVAIQGDVGYKLQWGNIKDVPADLTNFMLAVSSSYLLAIRFPIGTIGVTASREGVEYDTKTVANIVERLNSVRSEMGKEVNAKMASCPTHFERISAYLHLYELEQSMVDKVHFPAGKPSRWIELSGVTHATNGVRRYNVLQSFCKRKLLKPHYSHVNIDAMYGTAYSIVLKDTSNRLQKRVDKLIEGGMNSVFVLSNLTGDMTDTECDALKAEIFRVTGGFPNVRKVSEIELPVAERKQYSRNGPVTKFVLLDVDGSINKVTDSISSIEGPFIYQQVERLSFDKISTSRINAVRDVQKQNKEDVLPVVYVNEKGMQQIKKLKNEKYELSEYAADYSKKFDSSSMKRKYIAEAAKRQSVGLLTACVRTFMLQFDDIGASKDKKIARVSSFVKDYTCKPVSQDIQTAAKLLKWNDDTALQDKIYKVAEAIRNKAHVACSKNIVLKWHFEDPSAVSRLPKEDLKTLFCMYADAVNRV